MLYQKKLIKRFVTSFLGVAGISTLISVPGLAQAGLSHNSSQSILAQNQPTTNTPSVNTTSTPGVMNSSPSESTTPVPNTPRTNSQSSLSALDKEFMTKAAQSDMTEIQTSKLALQKSQDKTVRAFAQKMIKDHTNSSDQLKQIAKNKGFTLPKTIGSDNQALLTKLKNTSGQNFNRAYMQGQIQAHTKTQAEYQKYIRQGQDSDLQAFANKISPIVGEHLQMAQRDVANL
jgi:putative membrane protein